MEMCKTVPTAVSHDMDIRINDYQMYLSGERLENFAGVFGWFTGPITFFVFATLTMIFAGRIKERIPQPPLEKKVQINFWDGMFGVMRNKYKWVLTVVGLLDSLGNGMLVFTTVLYLYTFRLSGLAYSLIVALVSFAGTPPDLFTPYFIKRFS